MNIEKFFQGTVSNSATTFTLPYAAKNIVIANEGSENVTVSFSVNNVLTVGVGESKSFAGINLKTFTVAATSSSSTIEITVEYDTVYAQMEEYLPTGLSKLPSRKFEIFDDFLQQTITETDTPWIFNKGNDAQATDPTITSAEEGVIRLTTGNNSGTLSDDGSQLVCAIPVQADSGGLVMEARLKIATAITGVSVNVGLTDSTSLEEPFTIATATVTSVATDGACFTYDDGATSKTWFACAVDSDTDDTGIATTSVAPVADTYQTLRIEVDSDGNTVRYYINGTLVKTLTGGGVSPDVNLYGTVVANATTTGSKVVDVDYVYIAHNR